MNHPIPFQPATPAVAESVGSLTRNERIVLKALLSILALIFWASLAHAQGCGPSNPNRIVPTAPVGTGNNRAERG